MAVTVVFGYAQGDSDRGASEILAGGVADEEAVEEVLRGRAGGEFLGDDGELGG